MVNRKSVKLWKMLLFVMFFLATMGLAVLAQAATLTLPSSTTVIGEEAFYGTDAIDEVILPEGLVSIGARAFAYSSLHKITLPSTLNSIADTAFKGDQIEVVTAPTNSYAYRWAADHGFSVRGKGSKDYISGSLQGSGLARFMNFTSTGNWTVASQNNWIKVGTNRSDYSGYKSSWTGTKSDDGNEQVIILLSNNPSMTTSRTGKIKLTSATATHIIDVNQPATKLNVTFEANQIVIDSNCWWTISTDCDWIVPARTTGTWTNTVAYTLKENPSTTATRNGTITVSADGVVGSEKTYTVTQEKNGNLEVTGGTKANGIVCRTITVTATQSWSASTSDSWLKINTELNSQTASKTMSGSAGTNLKCYTWLEELPLTLESRTGTITFKCGAALYDLAIVQARTDAPMTGVSVSPVKSEITVGDSTGSTVTFTPTYATDKRVTWTSSNTSVATVDSNGKVTGKKAGSATITVETTDGGYTATYNIIINPYAVSLTKTKGIGGNPNGNGDLTKLTANAAWSATSDSSWLTVSPSSGSAGDNIQITFNYEKNSTSDSREGNVTFTCGTATATYTLQQNAFSLSINPSEQGSVSEGGASYKVAVTADGPWTARPWRDEDNWLSVTPTSGTGNGEITVTAAKNTSPTSRSGYIIVNCGGGVTRKYKLSQRAYFSLNLSKTSDTGGNASGGTVKLKVTNNTDWTATSSNSSWLTVSPSSGTSGTTEVTVTYAANSTAASRSGTVTFKCGNSTIGSKSVTYQLTQSAAVPVSGISLGGFSSVTTKVGSDTYVEIYSITPGDASNKILSVTSNNTNIAQVKDIKLNSTGKYTLSFLVHGVAAGSTTITVKAQDGSETSATCHVTVEPVSVNGYDRNKAVQYAKDHASDSPQYSSDCANFVSQCLRNGDLTIGESAYVSELGKTYSTTNVAGLYAYLRENYDVIIYSGADLKISNLQVGDVLIYWRYGDYGLDHTSIVSEVGNGYYRNCAHTQPENNQIHYEFPNGDTKIQYIIHIK